jgi:hypothetical protein
MKELDLIQKLHRFNDNPPRTSPEPLMRTLPSAAVLPGERSRPLSEIFSARKNLITIQRLRDELSKLYHLAIWPHLTSSQAKRDSILNQTQARKGELDDCYIEYLDTPQECSEVYYASVLESLGFEMVGRYVVPNPSIRGTSYIFARPDGLVLSASAKDGKMEEARMLFQVVPKAGQQRMPVFHHTTGNFLKDPNNGSMLFCGFLDAKEGIRASLEIIQDRCQFVSPLVSPLPKEQRLFLTTDLDFRVGRHVAKQNGHTEGTAGFNAIMEHLGRTHNTRLAQMPHWVRQMVGAAPIWEDFPAQRYPSLPSPKNP